MNRVEIFHLISHNEISVHSNESFKIVKCKSSRGRTRRKYDDKIEIHLNKIIKEGLQWTRGILLVR
jgi:hypothetical protein